MKIIARILAASVVLILVLGVAAAIFLPDLLKSEAVRERIRTAAEEALGRDVQYAELDFGIFPPSLVVEKVSVAGETAEAAPLAAAESISLRVALLPLLARTVVVDSLVVNGATIHLVRTKDGIVLPGTKSAASEGKSRDDDPGAKPSGSDADSGSAIDIAVARVDLRDCTVFVEDRAVSPPVTWEARNLRVSIRGKSLDDPIDFDLSFDLASGGNINATGNAILGGNLDIEADIRGLVMAPLLSYIDAGPDLAGTLTGKVGVRGPADRPTEFQVDVTIADGRLALDDLKLAGPVSVEADISGGSDSPQGTFAIDATRAHVNYGKSFVKPPGDTATVTGKVTSSSDGRLAFEDVRTQIRNFRSTASIQTGNRLHVVIDAPAFDISGWETAIPALADARPSGPIRIDALDVTTKPLEVRGGIHFGGVQTVLPDRGAVQITGSLVGAGDSIQSQNLEMLAGGERVAIDAKLDNLDRDLRYQIRTTTAGADTNHLVSTFSSKRDFIYGILNFDGDFNGTLAGDRSPLETLAGHAALDIDKGRLKGVSILQLTFEQIGSIGSVANLASQVLGGPDLSSFYEDDFREIRGTFDANSGVVRTDDFRIVYRDYTVDLRGTLRLIDLAVDMTGRLTLGEKIDAALGRSGSGAPNTISLARVTGTLDDPNVRVSPEVASAFLMRSGAGGKLQKVIDDKIGKSTGGALGNVLGGVLGGGANAPAAEKQAPPVAPPAEEPPAEQPRDTVEKQIGDAVGGEVGNLLKGVLGGKKSGE